MTNSIKKSFWIIFFLICSSKVFAVLTIEITGGTQAALPIAIVPFKTNGSMPPENVSEIIRNDLALSGRFSPLENRELIAQPHDASEIQFYDWRRLGSEGLVIGTVTNINTDQYDVSFQLFDVYKGEQLVGRRYHILTEDLRNLAHQISDVIYETLTGEKGIFTTHIAFVAVSNNQGIKEYTLQISDMDGQNPRTVLRSKEPILSPDWSPDGTQIAYVSFERKQSEIFIQELRTGNRQSIAAFPGINSAPAWSPDGNNLALVLSKDGNPEIYIYNFIKKIFTRLTKNGAIDTEPTWSPNGQTIIFTSDRGGQPQLYEIPISGGQAKRLTYEGIYNTSASFAPDGQHIAVTHKANTGTFHIAVLDLISKKLQTLTQTKMDESPSFSPNGRMIIYATVGEQGGALAAVSSDGKIQQRLVQRGDEVREPAWSH
ncbi:Tol-Pal system beta propeller repeat protein TolB [Candidatus Nitrosacidococcus tergens]|uniref:Tol-Pal system protein TolB n=1 Tax=Candidatus Nitrosacidococcus tergens TaxID=553981 RepID=A0A7G1QCL3_9GAMM|nr:Tol-Pal system beta propeller repeat protein TolB [Candidatus Nitrosacidococcus tergens]CAB1277447.1 periplasmic protein [Candidatus Nitrosacidococcus tergens]